MYFDAEHFLKSFLNFLQYCCCFICFDFFGCEACGILGPRPGIESTPPALVKQSCNHWTTREVLQTSIVLKVIFKHLASTYASSYPKSLHFKYQRCMFNLPLTLVGEGNGNPLQYSCLENSMDRGAWQATCSP